MVTTKDLPFLDSGFLLDVWVDVKDTATYLQNILIITSQRRKLIAEKT